MRYFVLLLAVAGFIGCEANPANVKSTPPTSANEHGDHDEDHAHVAHGPHGGHPFALQGLDAKLEAVTNKTNDLVQVFFLDHDAKEPKPLKIEKVVIKTDKLGGKSFELKPESPDANGLSAECRVESKDLISVASLSPTIEVTIDGKTYSGTMDFHVD